MSVDVARRAGREIIASPHVQMATASAADHWSALDLLHNFAMETPRRNDRPGYVDCTSLAIMRRLSIRSALAHDRHFKRFQGIALIPAPE